MQEMERSADVLAAGLLEVADPSLSSKFFLRQVYVHFIFFLLSHYLTSDVRPRSHGFIFF